MANSICAECGKRTTGVRRWGLGVPRSIPKHDLCRQCWKSWTDRTRLERDAEINWKPSRDSLFRQY